MIDEGVTEDVEGAVLVVYEDKHFGRTASIKKFKNPSEYLNLPPRMPL